LKMRRQPSLSQQPSSTEQFSVVRSQLSEAIEPDQQGTGLTTDH
jgi:hypothetical protein